MLLIPASLPTRRPYVICLIAVAAAWVLGFAVLMAMGGIGWLQLDDQLSVWVSVASGLVAVLASIPGWWIERRGDSHEDPSRVTVGFSAGVFIRLLGTVALMAVCSYHMPAAKEQLAGMILAWYVYLTTIEVTTLAVLLPRRDRRLLVRRQNAETLVP